MIEQIKEKSAFEGYAVTDIFSVRILSLLGAYGYKYPFARFYRQLDKEGRITAILSILDKDITVSCIEEAADKEELAHFIIVHGYDTVLCAELPDLHGRCVRGSIMKSVKTVEISKGFGTIDDYPNLFDLYNFIDYGDNGFEAWYVDINHRIRHGYAKAYTLNIDNEIITSAVFSSIHNGNAILTAVRTKPEFRGMGYASALISAMRSDFCGTVYLMREDGKNESFYKKLGFENDGIWRMYK